MFKPNIFSAWDTYGFKSLSNDIFAGICVGCIALPLSMAFAIASGLNPSVGIFTAVIAGVLIASLGGCKVQIGGPAGAFIVIVLGIVNTYGVNNLLIITAMSGVLLFLMGLFRVGGLIKHIPEEVILGFTNGIAVLIFVSQLKDFLGLRLEIPAEFISNINAIGQHISESNVFTVTTSLLCLLFLILWRITKKYMGILGHIPEILVVMIVSTTLVYLYKIPVETIGTRFGGIPHHFPSFVVPEIINLDISKLWMPICTLAILGAIESLLCARVADTFTQDQHNSNQELIGQGITNFLLPFFGGMPATGTITRTVTNIKSGATSPISGITHSLTLLTIVFFIGDFAKNIPLACLASILIYVAWNMGEWKALTRKSDHPLAGQICVWLVFILTVLLNLGIAIAAGIVYSVLIQILKKVINSSK